MTKQEAASALELLHGMGMTHTEVASLCGCNVRDLEMLSAKVMTFKRACWRNTNITVTRQSKINWPEELADISKIDDKSIY